MARITTEEFIRRAREVHGDRYDYSMANYTNAKTKLIIVCKIHGEFMKIPSDHMMGSGCPKCSGRYTRTLEEFINQANEVHGYKYDYSEVNYLNSHTKISIICKEHGKFSQVAISHLSGTGCAKCGVKISSDLKRKSIEDFIKDSIAKYGDLYDYTRVNYINCQVKVDIICNVHGLFQKSPSKFLSGQGCQSCSTNGFNINSEKSYFYILDVVGEYNFIGFGVTNNISVRLSAHKTELRKNNCSIHKEYTIQKSGIEVINLENYIKSTYNCSNSNIKGFKTESLTDISFDEIIQISNNFFKE